MNLKCYHYIYNANLQRMKSLPKIILSSILLFTAAAAHAQVNKIKYRDRVGDSTVLVDVAPAKEKQGKKNYIAKEIAFGGRLTSNGWGLNVDYGIYKRPKKLDKKYEAQNHDTRFVRLNIGEFYHPKEIRSYSALSMTGQVDYTGFKYGKTHNFYHADLIFGNRMQIGYREHAQTVQMHWTYGLGLSMAILKPYTIDHIQEGKLQYHDTTAQHFYNAGMIVSGSTLFDGWSNLSIKPGAVLNTAFHVDFSSKIKQKLAIEVGFSGYYYFNGISTMLEQEEKKLYPDAYINIIVGSRKFKATKKKK